MDIPGGACGAMSWWVVTLPALAGAQAVHRIESAGWIAVAISLGVCVLGSLSRAAASAVRGARERRIVRAWACPAAAGAQREADAQAGGTASGHLIGVGSGRHRGRAQGPPSPRELSLLVAEVSTRLRSGSPAAEAWRLALGRIGAGGTEEQGHDSCPRIVAQWARTEGGWSLPPARSRSPDAARSSAVSIVVACRYSHRLGAPLADVLDAIGGAIDDAQAVAEARRVASAGPLMSARVLSALPLVGIVAAYSLGASPWAFYTGGGAGSLCAAVGVVAWGVGIASCRRILSACARVREEMDSALACDLAASGLASGAAIPRVLDSLASACETETLAWTAASLRLGVSWAEAWEEAPGWAHPLRDALEAAWTCGAAPELMLARCAAWERRMRLADAKTKAEELGVRLVAPLGLFFLPAFLALGIGPLLAYLMAGIDM